MEQVLSKKEINFYYYTASFRKKSKWITLSEQLPESNEVQFFFLNFISNIIFELLKSDSGPVFSFFEDKSIWEKLRSEAYWI